MTTPIPPISSGGAGLGAGAVSSGSMAAIEVAVQAPALTAPPQPGSAPVVAPKPALEAAVQAAVVTQGGLASLFADLSAALQSPALPAPVQAAIGRVLAFQLPLDPAPSAADLRQATARSGLFLEAQLASPTMTHDVAPAADLKAALLELGQALARWSARSSAQTPDAITSQAGGQAGRAESGRPPDLRQIDVDIPAASDPAPTVSASTTPPPAPPYRGGPMHGQPPSASGLAANSPAEAVAGRLIKQTAAAISRQVLMQVASAAAGPKASVGAEAQWLFEIPLLTPQGAAVAQFEIDRDGSGATTGQGDDQPVWRARFSLDVDPMGPVHARISISGGRVRVALWAENDQTLARLSEQRDDLSEALLGDDLVAQVEIFRGAPTAAAPVAGRFMDKAV